MDSGRFDTLARSLIAEPTRRGLLHGLAGAALGLAALRHPGVASAKKRRKKKRKPGGPCEPACEGKNCGGDGCGGSCGSCTGGSCQDGACAPVPPCGDGVQNGDETDVDCGGACPRCGDGKGCQRSSDCTSRRCLAGICQPWPVCLAGQEYCPASKEQVQCGPGCACATSVETGATVCAGHSVRHCSTCTTDAECTTLLLLIGFPDTPGVCTRDLGGCACPGSNVCAPASCGCGSDGSLCD